VRSVAGTTFSNNNRLPAETLWNNLLADLNNISSTNPSFNTTSFVSQLSELITSLTATAANTQVQQVLSNWVQNVATLFNNRPNRYRPNQPPPSSLTIIDVTDPKKPLQISKTSAHFSVKDIYEPSSGQHQEEDDTTFYNQPQYPFNTFAQRRPHYPSYNPYYHYGYQQRPAPVPYPYGFPAYYFNHRQYQEYEQKNNYFRQPADHPVNPTMNDSELSDLEALAQLEQLLRNEEEVQRTVVSSNQRSDDGELEVEGRGLISSITTGAQAVRSNVKSIIKSIHSNLPTVSYKTLLVPSFGSEIFVFMIPYMIFKMTCTYYKLVFIPLALLFGGK